MRHTAVRTTNVVEKRSITFSLDLEQLSVFPIRTQLVTLHVAVLLQLCIFQHISTRHIGHGALGLQSVVNFADLLHIG